MSKITPLYKIVGVLLLVVLLPTLFYSGYEISSLSANEELFARMYRQQLDAVLFSLNQYAWDAASSWASGIQTILSDHPNSGPADIAKNFDGFLSQRKSIDNLFVADSALSSIRGLRSGSRTSGVGEMQVLTLLRGNREKVDRLIDFMRVEYRKIEPLIFSDSSSARNTVALVFVARDGASGVRVVAILLDARNFVRDVIARKLAEAAGEEFVLAVIDKRERQVIESTSPVQRGEIRQEKAFWLFPEYALGIRLREATIDEMVQSRHRRNMAFIIGLDIVLYIGAWLIYRTLRSEMALVRLKSDFVSNVSHELRTPLALIRMFAETLDMKRITTEKKRHEYYRTILQETERLTRLVNNILNFSRMEADRRQYHFREVEVNRIVKNVLDVYEYQLRQQGFSTEVRLDEKLPLIQADDEALGEALHNLIDNAIKYSDTVKSLEVRTGLRGDAMIIEVKDRGIGISVEHHKKIFEKFYRVSGGLIHTAKGSGLGLALVRHIIDAHHGTIEVESEPGKGSTFRLVLPRTKGAAG